MSSLLLALLLHLGAAWAAAPACEPLDQRGFRDLAMLLRSAVDRGDVAQVHAVSDELEAQLPCLDFAPDPHALAEVFVLRAIAAYAEGGDWEAPMAAALRIWPGVDRVVSSRHPLATWEPPEPPPRKRARPADLLYVNGLRTRELPAPGEVALVQRTDGTWWNSLLVGPDRPLPDGWVEARVEPPPHIRFRATAALGLAALARFQEPDFVTDWVQTVTAEEGAGVALGGAGRAMATFYGPLGAMAAGSGWLHGASPGLDAHATLVWTPGHLVLGAGAGTRSVEVFEGPPANSPLAEQAEERRQQFMLRYPAAVARAWAGRRSRWEAGLVLGTSPAVSRFGLDLALELPRRGHDSRWLFTAALDTVRGRFEEVGVRRDRLIVAGSARAWLAAGWAWGER